MSSSLKYRKEIDGLRAISVIAVVIFHAEISIAGISLLPGGFLGVDVFFVISGYLISRILLSELKEKGVIDFVRFYRRRARRLLPMLFAVIVASIPMAYLVLRPQRLLAFSKSIIAALAFVANLFFYSSTTSYGATDSNLMPLLNTWSLGIEEQFYLVVPLLLLALHRVGVRRFTLFFAVIAIGSFALALFLSIEDPNLNFYFPFTRAWELLAGALLAERELSSRTQSMRGEAPLSVLGLCLIVFSLAYFDVGFVAHPGPMTLVPVIGTVLVLRFSSSGSVITRLLSMRGLVFLGLISYSLYLWHFPLFAFARQLWPEAGTTTELLCIALSLFLSLMSWKFIEVPFRHSKRRVDLALALFLLALIGGFCVVAIQTKGFQSRVPEFLRESIRTKILTNAGEQCAGHAAHQCVFPLDGESGHSVVLVGDSHADTLAGNLLEELRARPIKEFVHMTRDGCPLIMNFENLKRGCTLDGQRLRLERINSSSPKIVVFAGSIEKLWSDIHRPKSGAHMVGYADLGKELYKTLVSIAEHQHLILVYPVPHVPVDVPQFFKARLLEFPSWKTKDALLGHPLTTSYEDYRQASTNTFEIYDAVQGPNVHRVYPHHIFCDESYAGRCVVNDAQNLFYRDKDHPSRAGAKAINEEVLKTISKIIEQSSGKENLQQ